MNKKIPLIKVHRFWQNSKQSSGICVVLEPEDRFPAFSSLSLERGWRNNEANVSCIPIGIYQVKLEYSNKFKTDLWEIKGVPNRSECKFHKSNLYLQLEGCIALGLRAKDLNNDGFKDVTNSGITLKAFHDALKGYDEATLVVSGDPGIE